MMKQQYKEIVRLAGLNQPVMPHILKGLINKQLRLACDTLATMILDHPTIYDPRLSNEARKLFIAQCKILIGDNGVAKLHIIHDLLARFLNDFEPSGLEEWEVKRTKKEK